MIYLYAFALTALIDFVWAWYTAAVAKDRALAASCTAAMILGLSGLMWMIALRDPLVLAAAAAGGFVGTFVQMRWRQIWDGYKDNYSAGE